MLMACPRWKAPIPVTPREPNLGQLPRRNSVGGRARVGGRRDRWAGWDRAPFTSDSHTQVAVFENCRSRQRAQIYQIRPPDLISARRLTAAHKAGRRAFSQTSTSLAVMLSIGLARPCPPARRYWSGGTLGHGDGQRLLGRASAAVRIWEQDGSGEARSGGLRRGDRNPM
jgi:hypothetical protein